MDENPIPHRVGVPRSTRYSAEEFRSRVFRDRVAQVETETSSQSQPLRETTREFRVAAQSLDIIVDTYVGSRVEDGAAAEVLAASKLIPRCGEPAIVLLARLKTRPPEFGYLEPTVFRSRWDGPTVPPGGDELLVVSQTGDAFSHVAFGDDDIFMIVRCPAASAVDFETLDVDKWSFDFRFTEAAVGAEMEALRDCLAKKASGEELPWEPATCFLFNEVDFALRRDHGQSVALGWVAGFDGKEMLVTMADEAGTRYEACLGWNRHNGRLSISKVSEVVPSELLRGLENEPDIPR